MDTLAAIGGDVYQAFIDVPVVVVSALALLGAWLLLRRWGKNSRRGPK